MPKEADFYTPGEAAKVLGLAELTVLGLLTSGQLEGHQDERARWWIPSAAIDAARHSKSPGHPVDPPARETTATTPAIPDHRQDPFADDKTTQFEAGAGSRPRTTSTDNIGQSTNESGWTTTGQAARAL